MQQTQTIEKKSKVNVRMLTVCAMLTAIAAVLQFFDFPLPFFASFLKLDFSDIPALIGAFSFGPVAGVTIQLVKNLIHLFQTTSGGIGELANFIVGAALVLPAGIIYKVRKNRSGALLGMLAGTLLMAAAGALANYFILIPFYTKFMPLEAIIDMCAAIIPAIDSLGKVILLSIVPFNIFKGVLVSLVTFLSYKRLSRLIHGKK